MIHQIDGFPVHQDSLVLIANPPVAPPSFSGSPLCKVKSIETIRIDYPSALLNFFHYELEVD